MSDPSGMRDKVAVVAAEHESLIKRLQEGKQRYDSLLASRREFDSDIGTLISSLEEQVGQLSDSCLTEDWRVESADAVLRALQV